LKLITEKSVEASGGAPRRITMHEKPEKRAKRSKKLGQVSDLPTKSLGSQKAASVKGGAGLTFGRETLKGDTSTTGDFSLTNRVLGDSVVRPDGLPPTFPKLP
jgi:hypothetical protein